MLAALDRAAHSLDKALEGYTSVCLGIPSYYAREDQFSGGRQMLMDRAAEELGRFSLYRSKLYQAKAALARGRNSCPVTVPIQALPDEIITQIFHVALWSQLSTEVDLGQTYGTCASSRCPELLSHVCSRWRQLAINCPTLWSHIDLFPRALASSRLLARADALSRRASCTPLFLRVLYLGYRFDHNNTKAKHKMFLDSIASRIMSLELVIPEKRSDDVYSFDSTSSDDWYEEEEGDDNMLEFGLESCIPGTLNRLTITDKARARSVTCSIQSNHIITQGARSTMHMVDLPRKFLEDLLDPITTLRLDRLYPCWTSKAYHNLVELRLVPKGDSQYCSHASISEVQLVEILRSSPMLRALELTGLAITDRVSSDTLITPVHLDRLELLSFIASCSDQLQSFLRWIVPGSLPLRLSIDGHHISRVELLSLNPGRDHSRYPDFFKTSHVVSLRLKDVSFKYEDLVEFLNPLSHLRFLTLEYCSCQNGSSALLPGEHGALLTAANWDKLYLLRHRSSVDDLHFIQGFPVQKLLVWRCVFHQKAGGHEDRGEEKTNQTEEEETDEIEEEEISETEEGISVREEDYMTESEDEGAIEQALSRICPTVETLLESNYPVSDWD